MRRRLEALAALTTLVLLLALQPSLPAQANVGPKPPVTAAGPEAVRPSSSSALFIENVGQFGDGARFRLYGGGPTLWLADDAVWLRQSYTPSFGVDNYPLEFGRGYFVRTTGPGRWRPGGGLSN